MPIPDSTSLKPLSHRAYAEHRKAKGLPGQSHTAVRKAIERGRLRESVRDGKIVDPVMADLEWATNTDYTDAPTSVLEARASAHLESHPKPDDVPGYDPSNPTASVGMTVSEAQATEKFWKAKQAELDYKVSAKQLIPAKDVEGRLVTVFSECKTKLLGIPSRAKQELPHLAATDIAELERLIREACEQLAGDPA